MNRMIIVDNCSREKFLKCFSEYIVILFQEYENLRLFSVTKNFYPLKYYPFSILFLMYFILLSITCIC